MPLKTLFSGEGGKIFRYEEGMDDRSSKKNSRDIVFEQTGREIVGGSLSQMATYSDLFERMRDPIFLLDSQNYHLLECNPSAHELFGKVLGEPGEHSFEKIFSESDGVKNFLGALTIENTESPTCDARFGDQIFELYGCRLKLADYTEVIQVIGHDVTLERSAREELETLSLTDEMTGLQNYRSFKEKLKWEHERAVQSDIPYSVLFFDVDHFKNYNDLNGHPAGDEVLKKIAQLIQQSVRKTDWVARYGGEEFVVLCPTADQENAVKIAEKIRKKIETAEFHNQASQPLGKVTVSIGGASWPKNANHSENLLLASDSALYCSKENGRNQVNWYEGVFQEQTKGEEAA